MSDTNVATVDRMTQAIFDQDHDTLAQIFTDGFVFHFRAPSLGAGDYKGVGGLLEVLGGLFEATNGDIKLDQMYCASTGDWVSEWEHATFGRNGKTLECDNAFNYRFENGRIAEMWMYIGALPAEAEAFFA
jgi:ketosteroid isomerase-like protein